MMNLQKIKKLISKDIININAIILKELKSNVPLIEEVSNHILHSGGKRIRPILAVLIAKAINYKGKEHLIIAALIECIHTATLLHDDVIDVSDIRHGKSTANFLFGNSASILVGDFIYTRAFQMVTQIKSFPILSLMANTSNIITEGEIIQLINCNNIKLSKKKYMKIIYRKTAKLFEFAAQSIAIIAKANKKTEKALKRYGRYLGMAFQLTDDILDYNMNTKKIGKNVKKDISTGKLTLPILHALQYGSNYQIKIIKKIITKKNILTYSALNDISNILNECESLKWTKLVAEKEANKAISAIKKIIPKSSWYNALISLAYFSIDRNR